MNTLSIDKKTEVGRIALALRRYKKKNPFFRYFVASKTGGNARGKGADRSVILATENGKTWFQFHKIWGHDNEVRAQKIVQLADLLSRGETQDTTKPVNI